MELSITEEHVEELVRSAVDRHVEEIIADIDVYGMVERMVREGASDKIEDSFGELVKSVAEGFLDKPVRINNGWSSAREYEHYTDFFVEELNSRWKSGWRIRDAMEKALKDKVNAIWNKVGDEVVREVLKRNAKEETDG